ncbi:hypothetical protein AcV5_003062 [Taiwanofungus camphoratus]|nr:hypothetical protein AcV5_003062 [Antrodia cinnamomea]
MMGYPISIGNLLMGGRGITHQHSLRENGIGHPSELAVEVEGGGLAFEVLQQEVIKDLESETSFDVPVAGRVEAHVQQLVFMTGGIHTPTPVNGKLVNARGIDHDHHLMDASGVKCHKGMMPVNTLKAVPMLHEVCPVSH